VSQPPIKLFAMTSTDRRIAALATGQLGTFTRAQAYDVGLSDRQLRSRVQSGSLLAFGKNSFRIAGAPFSLETELRALIADIGGEVWATGPTAAALLGFAGFSLRRPFHLLILHDRNVNRVDTRVHRATSVDLIDRSSALGIPVTSGVRTVIEIARTAAPDELDEAIESLLLLGLANESLLMRRIAALRGKGRHGLPALLDAIDRRTLRGETGSWLEREYLRLVAAASLPTPQTQQILSRDRAGIVRVDCRFPGTNVVVELLGYHFHRSRAQMNRDASRLNALIAEGFSPFQFTFDQVTTEPDEVVRTTTDALARSLRQPTGT
jgi:very-short-patch-repair endonuclease